MKVKRGFSVDSKKVVAIRSIRGFLVGFSSLLLGTTLNVLHFTSLQVGLILGIGVAGSVLASIMAARLERIWGLRRSYVVLLIIFALSGFVLAFSASVVLFAIIALTGTLSVDSTDNGPLTSLEHSMLGRDLKASKRIEGFGIYNIFASIAASVGALFSGVPLVLHKYLPFIPREQRFFLLLAPFGLLCAVLATRLSSSLEMISNPDDSGSLGGLYRSKLDVRKLSLLFATDAFGGGFIIQSFVTYWFEVRYHAASATMAIVFFITGLLQSISFSLAIHIAKRFGLLRTMVFSHLPSNILLTFLAFAPNLSFAIALFFVISLLSKMDVPTRQAYVMGLVNPEERTAAATYTNSARNILRPLAPVLGGMSQSIFLGLPFLVAGVTKGVYDLSLWAWFRNVHLDEGNDIATNSRR